MKYLILLAMMMSLNVQARQFSADSVLPQEVKELILQEITKKVPCAQLYSIRELKTELREEWVDQGIIDLYYTTELRGSYLYDSYHPAPMDIVIESVEYAVSNPRVQKYFILNSNLEDFKCEDLF